MSRARLASRLGLVLVVAGLWIAYRPYLELELVGWDTFPLIAASRVSDPADLLGIWTEKLMDGRYPGGDLYRPVANLTFALDYAVWELRGFGYHLTDLILLVTSTCLIFLLARQLYGGIAAPVVAAAAFSLHPVQIEVFPTPARRPDQLALVFLLAALCLQFVPRRLGRTARAIVTAACCVLAVGSKETGAIALPVLWGLQASLVRWGSRAERSLVSARNAVLPAILVGLLLLARLAVLGGLGGHDRSSLWGGLLRAPTVAVVYLADVLMPQPLSPHLLSAVILVVGALVASQIALLSFRWAPQPSAHGPFPRVRPIAVFLLLWLAAASLATAASGVFFPWYGIAFLPIGALFVGLMTRLLEEAARYRQRARSALCGVAVVLLLIAGLGRSPLFHRYEEWTSISAGQERFLEMFRSRMEASRTGDRITIPGLPLWEAPRGLVGARSAAGLADYSLQAYAELVLPGRSITIVGAGGVRASPPDESAVLVELDERYAPAVRSRVPGIRGLIGPPA